MTLNIPYPYTREDAVYFYSAVVQSDKTRTMGICFEDNSELIGVIGIQLDSNKDWVGEIGYWIGKEFRNKGYMTLALKKFIHFCFHNLKLIRICAAHNTNNPASGRVMQKAGMQLEGTFKCFQRKNDLYIDLVYYSIIHFSN